MDLPKNHGDVEEAKLRLASRFKTYESHLFEEIQELANSGFADVRLCAMACSEMEKAFLVVEKALRIGAPANYAKQPMTEKSPFRQRVDPNAALNVGEEQSKIEWKDLNQP